MFGGIGHMDERLKIFPNKIAMTDTPQYRQTLEALGYRVIEIPRGDRPFETYINSILVNGVAFVPIFNQANDSFVVNTYSQLGYRVVPIYTNDLPNDGNGSLHCITMTYPERL
jgi:agmatine/peptidylarginine deiminase